MNRIRPPGFRSAVGERRSASWTELFYDLAFVVAIRQLVLWLPEGATAEDFAEFAVFMLVLWWTWASFTFFTDRYDRTNLPQFVLMLVQVGAVVSMAAILGDDFRYRARLDEPELPVLSDVSRDFAIAYVVSRAALIALYFTVWRSDRRARPLVNGYLAGFSFETILWIYSIFAPDDALRLSLWLGAIAVSFATPFAVRHQQALSPLTVKHFPERFWLFTIIVMGESLAAIVLGLGAADWTLSTAVIAFAGVIVTVGFWWIYFSSVEGEGAIVRRTRPLSPDWRPTIWIYSHLPLTGGIVICGVGFEHLIKAVAHAEHVDLGMAPAGFAVAVLSVAVIFMTPRLHTGRRFLARGASRVLAGVLGLAAIGIGRLAGPEGLALSLAAVAMALVAFDALADPDAQLDGAPDGPAAPASPA